MPPEEAKKNTDCSLCHFLETERSPPRGMAGLCMIGVLVFGQVFGQGLGGSDGLLGLLRVGDRWEVSRRRNR